MWERVAAGPGGNPADRGAEEVFKSTVEASTLSLKWEAGVTQRIDGLVELAVRENDQIPRDFLWWFLKEQLEDVSTIDTLLKVAERAGEDVWIVEDYVARHGDHMRAAGGDKS